MARRVLTVAVVCLLSASRASAQTTTAGEPDPANVRVRIGPLYLNPTIALTNLGIDTNVFNEATVDNPKRDFTLTVEPRTDLWLRMGRTWLNGAITEQIVWFQKYADQRSTNNRYQIGWQAPLNRITLKVGASYGKTRERPGFEIDERAQRIDKSFDGAVEFRVLAKTHFGVRAIRNRPKFDEQAQFRDKFLRFELNRTSTTFGLTVRNQATPLTNVTVDIARGQDRFEFSPLRDSNSTSATVGLHFDPFALLKGGATVGYRNFHPLDPGVPDFKGVTANIDLTYVLLGSTRFGVQANRDVDYSFDVSQPYFLLTGVSGSIAQQLFGPVDVVGRISAQRLAYRNRAGIANQALNRTDHVRSYGGGFGYHMGKDLRIGVNVAKNRRDSELIDRQYEGLTFGTAVTYGF